MVEKVAASDTDIEVVARHPSVVVGDQVSGGTTPEKAHGGREHDEVIGP